MSAFKFTGQKLDVDLIASIVKLLDANSIPNVMWGPYVFRRYGVPLILQEFTFVIPDQHIARAREVLLTANFASCCQDDCRLVQPTNRSPRPYAHFILANMERPSDEIPGWHYFRLDLHKKSQLLWTLPDIPLGAPAPDNPNYMLVTDNQLDKYNPRSGLGREPYTHHPVKIPTLPRYAESLAYMYLRECLPRPGGCSRAGFWLREMSYIGQYCRLQTADLEARIQRLWQLQYHPSGLHRMFRHGDRLAAELSNANFFPLEEEEGE
ncbi:hypothetical protein KXW98_008484 [Aspergillus fumigatus]|uniref:Uncharacterized protein n=2 Tax=Aspergillus fumigatus TaxID=746128 RepID=B0Y0C9_ASPFC|nr:conserved hypothetical protein [Aspergillus fumigatus A1163]KAF4284320.1 hypothetical protein CNMCM8689_006277 [Aspergillus fumigatus]KAF4291855.1 hypothetical protein CNMCM8686_008220 [Aspergillus fumigatus]KAH1280309.1 hypothetical protein KXX45_000041 [Aspergillus fumigatus]KAH1286526.1 hypothetical protein KXX30_008996 [Aspergillus fumigatus]